jgi:flavodoxin
MGIEVRYVSRSGNTKKLADAIAAAAGTVAKTADAPLAQKVDLLFIGGALYAGNLDGKLRKFVLALTPDKVKAVAVFSTSAAGKSILPLFDEMLKDSGITLMDETFFCKGKFLLAARGRPSDEDCARAAAFAKKLAGIVK